MWKKMRQTRDFQKIMGDKVFFSKLLKKYSELGENIFCSNFLQVLQKTSIKYVFQVQKARQKSSVMDTKEFDVREYASKLSLEPPDPIICFSGIRSETLKLPNFVGYKKILLMDCKDFVVECDQKLLTLSIVDSKNFVVRLPKGCVGNVDVFRSHFGKIIVGSKVPFFQTELSSSIEYRVFPDATTHIVTNSREIYQAQEEWKYEFPLNEWSERTFLMLEKSPYTIWMMKTEQPYELNQISQNIFN
ncbi:hypothetical protein ISTM_135 [Insectomime virus]|uniref:Uncharacterized protein n=1 Tax=Tunisvirus fontaine2 TaxID=1421067 RepID=V9SG89_9VIRU|nr:hypothetical protein D1R32_gp187 [Tunisvirus fontaine2]AHA46033.1 hypothetical protein ISTM_135 [Insectomime virus]AHC54904.1 hypothetical protein TNS_ORF186 [Tunisvirus fontaine2]